jgi:hypothetical protein
VNTRVESDSTDVARPLRVLVPLIKDELAKGYEAGIEHFRRAGALLIEAKGQVRAGDWHQWLGRNFALSIRTAQTHMHLARESAAHTPRAARAETLSAFKDPTAPSGHGARWEEPVRRILADRVDPERLARAREDEAKEERLLRQLGYQLIDIGYKALAAKLHPDHGGSTVAMKRLNHVRTILRNALQ